MNRLKDIKCGETVKVRDYELSIRKSDAEKIIVE